MFLGLFLTLYVFVPREWDWCVFGDVGADLRAGNSFLLHLVDMVVDCGGAVESVPFRVLD